MTTEIHPERNMKFVPLQYDGDAFVRLLGWYITEGSVYTYASGSTRVNIAQREAGDVPAVQQMLEDCGIDYHTEETQVRFTSGILGPIIEDVCGKGSENKHVPEFSSGFSGEQKRILFQTLMAGGGATKSKRLRDDFMQLATELGQTVRYSYDESFDGWCVRYGEPNNHFRMNRSSELRESEPDEGVYCLTVADNHTMLCGRDGKFSWTGNSFYGYTGWDKSPLFDPETAAAVTLTGQVVIKKTAAYINEETVAEVTYGDTDSNYVEYPHDWDQERVLEYASEICDTLNDEVYPDLCNQFNIDPSENRWFIELEMLASDFFQSGGKKFYAYKSIWNEGMDFDAVVNGGDGKINISGYACQKSNFSEITKTTQKDVLTTILEGGSKQDVADIMFAAANSIDPANPDWESIGMPQGLGQKIDREKAGGDEYYDWSSKGDHPQQAHARGAWFANHLLDVNYGQDDQPKRVYIKPELTVNGESVDVICFEKEHDLEPIKDRIKVDLTDKNMQEKVLVNPMDDILDAFGMEMEAAMMGQAQTQSQLGAF